ncbi:hypothetical protein PFMC_00139 [Plasmodium falciparum CAMP/Malaysia]|uniref:Uncharacterized protein n=1 Tax=Plasmodium falciparum (isolate Camp / Malaysia) TaxID=5835 RepID=A0A024XFR2_PLAFC|nr:hypothetical protein PFMC_00139 [Plasmodium falciparum CAMP/Malaysia]
MLSFYIPTVGYVITNENNYNITSNNMRIILYLYVLLISDEVSILDKYIFVRLCVLILSKIYL